MVRSPGVGEGQPQETIQRQPRELRHVFCRRTEATSRWLPMMFDDPADGGFDSRRRHHHQAQRLKQSRVT